jgi:peptidyl-prolyl cis-trans isomerase C
MGVLRNFVVFVAAGLLFGIAFAHISFANSNELAKIDGYVITETDFKKRMMMITPERKRAKSDNKDKENLLNKMIDEELLLREAQKLNLCDDEDYKFKVETYKRDLLVNLYLERYLKDRNTEENQRKYYADNKEKYAEKEMVRISVISVGSEDEAKEVLKKAQAGEDFAELAVKYSKGPFVNRGGDFGFRTRNSMKKEIADAAFSVKNGEIKGPVKTEDGGYHIIKRVDHKEAGPPPFEESKNKVAIDYGRKLLSDKISGLREAVKIQIDSKKLEELRIE